MVAVSVYLPHESRTVNWRSELKSSPCEVEDGVQMRANFQRPHTTGQPKTFLI